MRVHASVLSVTGALPTLPTLHQTVSTDRLSSRERDWRASWLKLNFSIRTADDAQALRDIQRVAVAVPQITRVYIALETAVQRADVWRYAILWLEGGVYADIDVVAHAPIVDLVRAHDLIFCALRILFTAWE